MHGGAPRVRAKKNGDVIDTSDTCPDDPMCIKKLKLVDVRVPSVPIHPTANIPIVLDVINWAHFIDGTDKDRCGSDSTTCDSPGPLTNGYCAETVVLPEWRNTVLTRHDCFTIDNIAPTYKGVEMELPNVGEEGEFNIESRLAFQFSDNSTDVITRNVTISQDGTMNPEIEEIKFDPNELNGSGSEEFNLLEWAVDNPGQAVVLGFFGTIVVRTATETIISGD